MRVIYAALLLIFVGAILVFCVQNMEFVGVRFLGWKATLPQAAIVFLSYLIGMVSGWGLLSFLRQSLRKATEHKE